MAFMICRSNDEAIKYLEGFSSDDLIPGVALAKVDLGNAFLGN